MILTSDNLPWDPLAYLTGEKDLTPKKGLAVKMNWEPFKGQEVFNVFQVPRTKVTCKNKMKNIENSTSFYCNLLQTLNLRV